ncbi:hypothetical protein QBC34DRAFT_300319 [Podospora aff. communis PSN243]|uniref:Uncharacterized protein n=1 Tax=Podospora aff. communis PSN243 TaxID=3040156 RepID=A0AAV9GL15_9PEZI|nr:hypothetical protein QBC34DRAFT_300319 [Podospora aff. communis PSN243]
MASPSHPQPTWAEASHLLSTQGGFNPNVRTHYQHDQPDSEPDSHMERKTPEYQPAAYKATLLQRLNDTWLFELLGLVVSAASLAAIVHVLRRYDGQRIPDWTVSFNTVISILAVVSKMGALYGATNAVSQLKWTWFTENGKKLVDYKTFDSGSRGMTGAAMLAWSLKGKNAAVIGAVAIIIGVAAGPFAQQIVHFYDAEYIDISQTSWLARADILDSFGPKLDSSTWSLDPMFKANSMMALFLPTQEVLTQPRFNCPTGNCTFAPFSTLAFCDRCVDITPQLDRTCGPTPSEPSVPSCNVTFPGGPRLSYFADPDFSATSTYMVLNSTSTPNSTALSNLTWPPTIYQSIRAVVPVHDLGGTTNPYLDPPGTFLADKKKHHLTTSTPFIATECALVPCVHHLSASVSSNTYSESLLSTFSTHPPPEFNSPLILSPPWDPETNYTIHYEFLESAAYTAVDPLGGALKGRVQTHDDNQAILVTDLPPPGQFSRANDALEAVFYADFNGTTCPTPEDNVRCAFRMLAMALTKAVRDAGVVRNGTEGRQVVRGEARRVGTFVRVEWGWFALPVAVWGLSVVVVGLAMWASRGVPLWRDSALPLVLLLGEGGGEVQEAALVRRAEGVEVCLVGTRGGGLRVLTKGL